MLELKASIFSRKILIAPLLLGLTALPVSAQHDSRGNDAQRGHSTRQSDNNSYYSGMRDGGHGGNYDHNSGEHYREGYHGYYGNEDNGYRHQDNGIGPGKGALIGGAGGAVLGALFGGGLKGAVIGGAAGAGVGAVAGAAAQDHRRDEYRDNY